MLAIGPQGVWMVYAMHNASNGQPAEKGNTLRIGDKVRTPQGLMLTINAFNREVFQRMHDAGWPSPPPPPKPRHIGPARRFKRVG